MEEVKQKMVETQNGIKINEFKNYFEEWKNVLIDVLHQMENTLKVLKFKHVRINTQILINKFQGCLVPPHLYIYIYIYIYKGLYIYIYQLHTF